MSKSQTHDLRNNRDGRDPITKGYQGKRSYNQVFVTVDGRALDPRLDLVMHSPNGFEWGYGGSGPAQLSLALLADHLSDGEAALSLYQDFKSSVVAGLPREGWILTSAEIDQALRAIEERR